MTTNAMAMVDQVLAGHGGYPHYFAREIYYTGTQNGPHVVVYLSKEMPVLAGLNVIWVGSGLRVECYTSMTTNAGAQRYAVYSFGGGNISWGVQDLVVSDCRSTLIGGIQYDVPSSVNYPGMQAAMASAASNVAMVLLLVFVLIAQYWRIFRSR